MIEASGLSDPGCIRSNNEDYYRLVPEIDLYVVADGMGGAQAGEHASKLAVDTVVSYVLAARETSGEVLLRALQEANRKVLAAAGDDAALQGMGTTLTAGWKVQDELLIANVGDSRAYLYANGELHIITDDQTWVNEIGRRLGIADEALKNHPMRHVLTMAIGVSETLRVHSYVVPLQPGIQFLLCSDGLHGVVAPSEIVETLGKDEPLEAKCRELVEAAKRGGGPDNITAVLLKTSTNGTGG